MSGSFRQVDAHTFDLDQWIFSRGQARVAKSAAEATAAGAEPGVHVPATGSAASGGGNTSTSDVAATADFRDISSTNRSDNPPDGNEGGNSGGTHRKHDGSTGGGDGHVVLP